MRYDLRLVGRIPSAVSAAGCVSGVCLSPSWMPACPGDNQESAGCTSVGGVAGEKFLSSMAQLSQSILCWSGGIVSKGDSGVSCRRSFLSCLWSISGVSPDSMMEM